jgi:predicted GIY-YIG superfamily endonuclease
MKRQSRASSSGKPAFVNGASIYILQGSDGSYYTGITRPAVEERMSEHTPGLIPGYTFHAAPCEVALFRALPTNLRGCRRGAADQRMIASKEAGLHTRGFSGAH